MFSMFEQAQIQEFKEVKAMQPNFVSLVYIWAENGMTIVEKLCECAC